MQGEWIQFHFKREEEKTRCYLYFLSKKIVAEEMLFIESCGISLLVGSDYFFHLKRETLVLSLNVAAVHQT